MDKFRADTIEDVILIMDEIVRNCRLRGSRLAYFTVLYRTTTHMVKKYCDEGGFFEDDKRMRKLDVAFANFYFKSLFADQHFKTKPPSRSWQVTFEAADNPKHVLLQHLLVGMNAHISLDLGVATALVGGDLSESLKRDFNKLNDVLASLIHVVQTEISSVSPLVGTVSKMTNRFENFAFDHGIRMARGRAWRFAEELSTTPRIMWQEVIAEHDKQVANISRRILSPGWVFQPALRVIRRQEQSAPHEIISGLAGDKWYEEAHQKVMDVIGEINDPHSDLMSRETHLMRIIRPEDLDTSPGHDA